MRPVSAGFGAIYAEPGARRIREGFMFTLGLCLIFIGMALKRAGKRRRF